MTIDEGQVRRIAGLARLDLSDAELERMASELGRIVAYVEKLGELANAPGFGDLQTTTRAIERMPLREDEPGDSLEHELAMSEAPHSLDGGFAVPTFVDEG